ncbi:MAG TPA: hypothetical protein VN624_14580 [Rhodanobacter sp.]|nr:hypothetical protein [Rhodanobacter sp.]
MTRMRHARPLHLFPLGLIAAGMVGVAPLATACGSLCVDAWALPVGNVQLDAMRGGFDSGNGLLASFGIDRVVYVNGSLATHTSVSIPDIGHMTAAQAHALAAVDGVLTVVQGGQGNTAALVPSGAATATVIQNSLDGQHIQSLTTMDASVDHLDQFRSARLGDTLQGALIQSLGH